MTLPCWFVPQLKADGPRQMALDEAMLEMVGSGEAPSLYRQYVWSKPTLSLGYFQRLEEALAEPRFQTVPIVRRPSGGGALWHEDWLEITYAVVVPEHHPLARPSSKLYQAVHTAIANLLRSDGIPAERRGDLPHTPRPEPKPLLCFLDQDDDDLLIDGHKIVGSAQRRRRGAVLQHGSILLRRPTTIPELPGLLDLVTHQFGPHYLRDVLSVLCHAIFMALDFNASHISPSHQDDLNQRASQLETDRYRTTDWNAKR